MADSKLCEVYLAVKNKATINTSSSSRPIVVKEDPIIIDK